MNITKKTVVTLSLTAGQWQLYSTMRGVGLVARNINAGVAKAINSARDWNEAYTLGRLVLAKYGQFGAMDTEPRGVLQDVLDEVFGAQPDETY